METKQDLYCRVDGYILPEYSLVNADNGIYQIYNSDNETTQFLSKREFYKLFSFEPIETKEEEEELNHPTDYEREMRIAYYGTTQVF